MLLLDGTFGVVDACGRVRPGRSCRFCGFWFNCRAVELRKDLRREGPSMTRKEPGLKGRGLDTCRAGTDGPAGID